MKENHTATTIEYFLSIEQNSGQSKLLYFDAEGQSVEKEVSRAVLDNALRYFSNSARAVRRSSGGLMIAEPVQIVLYEQPGQRTSVRVKVKFRDFTRRNGAHLCVSQTKVVTAEELHDPFPYEYEGERAQSFALDFGQGIVPVKIFGYEEHEGTVYAYFLEMKDAERLAQAGGEMLRVQPFRVEQSALRWIGSASGNATAEQQQASLNYQRLSRTTVQLIPRELRAGATITVPPRASDELLEFLRRRLERRFSRSSHFSSIDTPHNDAEILLPFRLPE